MPLANLCHLLRGKTGKNLGAKIDIINTLSMSMVKISSQLYIIMAVARVLVPGKIILKFAVLVVFKIRNSKVYR